MDRYKVASGGALMVTALLVGACGSDDSGSTSSAATASSSAPAGGPGGQLQTFTAVDLNTDGENGANANTGEVVEAATAFLDSLSSDLKSKAVYEFSDNQSRQTWSNFPASTVARKGVPLGDLSDAQKTAALALVKTMLSEDGYAQVQAIQASDDWLSENSAEGSGSTFGSDNYYLAVYGTPSASEPFMVQFGGHHLARNYTYDGDTASVTPNFTGTEPKSFESGGATVEPLKLEASTMVAAFDALSDDQRQQAELSGTVDDILMGPGVDSGEFPTSEGVLAGDLSAQQKELVTAAIQAWVGDAAPGVAASLMSAYEADLDQTRLAFAGSTTVDGETTYLRIDGPRVWIELINARSRSTSEVHYHGVYRDKNDDYGSTNPSGS